MIVCLCHGITDREVRDAVAGGKCSIGEVYGRLGLRPNCASCVPYVCDAVREARTREASPENPMAVAAE